MKVWQEVCSVSICTNMKARWVKKQHPEYGFVLWKTSTVYQTPVPKKSFQLGNEYEGVALYVFVGGVTILLPFVNGWMHNTGRAGIYGFNLDGLPSNRLSNFAALMPADVCPRWHSISLAANLSASLDHGEHFRSVDVLVQLMLIHNEHLICSF